MTWLEGIQIFIVATIAMLIFTAATQGYFFARNRWYETVLLLLIAFSLFRPGFWMDRIVEPYQQIAPQALVQAADDIAPGTELRFWIDGEDAVGNQRSFLANLVLGEGADGAERLANTGVELLENNGKTVVDFVAFDSAAERAGLAFDQVITGVEAPQAQPAKQLMYIPAGILLLGLIALQRRRRNALAKLTPAEA